MADLQLWPRPNFIHKKVRGEESAMKDLYNCPPWPFYPYFNIIYEGIEGLTGAVSFKDTLLTSSFIVFLSFDGLLPFSYRTCNPSQNFQRIVSRNGKGKRMSPSGHQGIRNERQRVYPLLHPVIKLSSHSGRLEVAGQLWLETGWGGGWILIISVTSHGLLPWSLHAVTR